MPRLTRRLLPQAAAAAVALLGALFVLAGALQATVLAPDDTVAGRLEAGDRPIVTTAVGLLELDGPVEVSATASGRPVFLGIGRAADVAAYLGKVSRHEITGHDAGGRLLATRSGSEPSLPDPAAVDIWAVSVRAEEAATLAWPGAPGQWQLVAATDGTAPAPAAVEVTWTGAERSSAAPALIAVGVVLLVAGGVGLTVLLSRREIEGEIEGGSGEETP